MTDALNVAASAATKTIKYTHTVAVTKGQVILLQGRVLIAFGAYAANAEGIYIYASERVEIPSAAVVIVAGEEAYWDDTAKLITNVATANTICGMFVEDAASGAGGTLELNNNPNLVV